MLRSEKFQRYEVFYSSIPHLFFFSKSIKKYFRFRLAFMVSVPRFVAQCTSHVIFFLFRFVCRSMEPEHSTSCTLFSIAFVLWICRFRQHSIFFFTSICQLLIIFYVTLSTSIRFLIFSSLLSFSSLGFFFFFFFVLYPGAKGLDFDS
jgi:hypothetical protein